MVVEIDWDTGSFALMLKGGWARTGFHRARSRCRDPWASTRRGHGGDVDIEWYSGFAADLIEESANKGVSSLILHQMSLTEKAVTLRAMYRILRPGGLSPRRRWKRTRRRASAW